NGRRVSLKNPRTILTTRNIKKFWEEVQILTANEYSLENTQIITNSDGGNGYTADKFQTAFSQSTYPVLNQLDEKDQEQFNLWMDSYESTLELDKDLKKFTEFKTYITGNWDRIFD